MLRVYDYVEMDSLHEQLADLVQRAIRDTANQPQLPIRAAAAMQASGRAKRAALEAVSALVRTVEAKDQYTRRHSEHVAHYAVHLARAISLTEQEIESIRIGALLHDIGKIGVPDAILTKPGKLTAQEFDCIRRHPLLGQAILSDISMFRPEAQLVRSHHENWDGNGYPDGRAEEDIPLGARVIQIADCLDAMLMERSYKSSYCPDKMINELISSAGTQFDPRLAAVAVNWCRQHGELLILPSVDNEDISRQAGWDIAVAAG